MDVLCAGSIPVGHTVVVSRMFDKQDPQFAYPPAEARMRGYAQGSPPDYVPRKGHKWCPGERGHIYREGYHCRNCGLRMWTEYEDVVLSKYTPDWEMPTCEESAPEQVMEQ